jgi:hypothetical protein
MNGVGNAVLPIREFGEREIIYITTDVCIIENIIGGGRWRPNEICWYKHDLEFYLKLTFDGRSTPESTVI